MNVVIFRKFCFFLWLMASYDIFSGLSGGALVEAPRVVNRTIVAWDVVYAPGREFAIDMAGFAINLQSILNSK